MKIKIPELESLERRARAVVKKNRRVQQFLARKQSELSSGVASEKFSVPQARVMKSLLRIWLRAIIIEAMYKILKGYDVSPDCAFNRAK